ncbi:transmembrane and coiled-coil domain-containing protein 5A-like isoform X2 [Perognathus longimembris pacificus]|uniref:transmembrane and coiled-coil domain-containing protein 5A-like isoform X2 n=1 Tax=Perognathus longimembris pacificus TaxID=214514 RepID=UPI00201846E3|nr:transmembrane and coiled-coil domain-containing protein 5A-like isoform X2 [Perognathus longimembris pacificus]
MQALGFEGESTMEEWKDGPLDYKESGMEEWTDDQLDYMESAVEEWNENQLDYESEKMILRQTQLKKTITRLTIHLESDMQRLDEENQELLLKIQEKEREIQRLETEITGAGDPAEEEELEEENNSIEEREAALQNLKEEIDRLEQKKKALVKSIAGLQAKLSSKSQEKRKFKRGNVDRSPEVAKIQLQQLEASCTEQEKELVKVMQDYEFVTQLCEDQARCIKNYQATLRRLEEEQETELLDIELSKVLNMTSLISTEDSQNHECNSVLKKSTSFCKRIFRVFLYTTLFFARLLGYLVFHLCFINPDILATILPRIFNRNTLWKLTRALCQSLTLETEDVLPH